MIKANELRIGNIIGLPIPSNIFNIRILSIAQYGCDCMCDTAAVKNTFTFIRYEEVCGIELTPEILEKCEFEKKENGCYLNNHIWIVPDGSDSGNISIDWRLEFNNTLIKIDFVHQLQNIYFTLTSEELKVNL